MKKKVLLVGLIIFALVFELFILTGCENKKDVEENKAEESKVEETPVVDETLVKINNLEFHVNQELSFKDIKYKTAEEFKKVENDHYVQYNYYQEDGTNLLFFRIFYYEGKTIEDAIKDLGLESNITLTDGKTDNIEYKYYDSPRDDGGTIHFYFINNNGSTYVLHFVSRYDIKDFEDKVVKDIKF